MKILFHLILLISIFNHPNSELASKNFDRDLFYKSILSNDLKLIEQQLENINKLKSTDKDAFEGTLLMKKSGLLKNKKEKLELFKNGHKLLESSILKNPNNCEYRFLRLIIQENAPKILGYNKNIKEDCILIKKEYKNTSKLLKKNIIEFSKNSLNLKLSS